MTKLNRGAERLLGFLKAHENGDTSTRDEVMRAMKWKESTLKTYLNKNMLAPFLLEQPDGRFRIIKGGDAVQAEDIAVAFSQKKPLALVLARGDVLQGLQDEYTLMSPLGAGAVGHVWRAHAKKSGDIVAVKIVNPRPDLLKPTVFANVKQRFGREARNAPAMEHDCLVRYLDHGTFRKHPFLTMELAEQSVRDLLDRSARFDEREAARVVFAAATGLAYLHSKGCVHRDVKPHNLLQTRRGYVLADLGIVRWDDLNPEFISAGTITQESIQLGSFYYMAPEQQQAPHSVNPASDVYSLGVTWYELLAGKAPLPLMVAAGDLEEVANSDAVNRMIRSMVRYRPSERPALSDVLEIASNSLLP